MIYKIQILHGMTCQKYSPTHYLKREMRQQQRFYKPISKGDGTYKIVLIRAKRMLDTTNSSSEYFHVLLKSLRWGICKHYSPRKQIFIVIYVQAVKRYTLVSLNKIDLCYRLLICCKVYSYIVFLVIHNLFRFFVFYLLTVFVYTGFV